MMLANVTHECAVPAIDRFGSLGGAHRVRDDCPWDVPDAEAGFAHPPAEIDVLHVEEQALVKSADRIERGSAYEESGARQPVDIALDCDWPKLHRREEAAESRHSAHQEKVTDR